MYFNYAIKFKKWGLKSELQISKHYGLLSSKKKKMCHCVTKTCSCLFWFKLHVLITIIGITNRNLINCFWVNFYLLWLLSFYLNQTLSHFEIFVRRFVTSSTFHTGFSLYFYVVTCWEYYLPTRLIRP